LTRNEAARVAAAAVKSGAGGIFGSFTVWAGTLECVTYHRGRITIDRDIEPRDGAYIAAAIAKALPQ